MGTYVVIQSNFDTYVTILLLRKSICSKTMQEFLCVYGIIPFKYIEIVHQI